MQVYADDEEIAEKIREQILTLPNHYLEELRTGHGGFKFEFYATRFDGIKLVQLGARAFGEL